MIAFTFLLFTILIFTTLIVTNIIKKEKINDIIPFVICLMFAIAALVDLILILGR